MGLSRGFVREVLSLVIWSLAVILALTFSDDVAAALPKEFGESFRYPEAVAIVFIGTLIVGGIVQWLIRRLVETTGLSGTDRLLGLLFGGLRGAVVCILAMVALRPFVGEQPWWQASRTLPVLGSFESDVTTVIASAGEWISRPRHNR